MALKAVKPSGAVALEEPSTSTEPIVKPLDAETLRRCVRAARVASASQQAAIAAQQAFYAALDAQRWTLEKSGLDPNLSWAFDDERLTATHIPPQQR